MTVQTVTRPAETAPPIVHILSWTDGYVTIAICGHRKANARILPSSTPVECVVCAEIDAARKAAL